MPDSSVEILDEVIAAEEERNAKRSPVQKFIFTFINDDLETVKKDIIYKYVVPGIIDTMASTLKGAVDMLFYKDTYGNRSYSSSNNYHNAYDRNKSNTRQNTQSRPSGNMERYSNLDHCVEPFDSRGKAEEKLYLLRKEIADHGSVSVGYFFDIVGKVHTYTDWDWGWTDLNDRIAYVRPWDRGYCIHLPRVVAIK